MEQKLPFPPTYNDLLNEVKRLRKVLQSLDCIYCNGTNKIAICGSCRWPKADCKCNGDSDPFSHDYENRCGRCWDGKDNRVRGLIKLKDTIWTI